jgi:CubicO group peptidase (beta-lactamase class C family)
MDRPLELIRSWPVDHAAAAVRGPDGHEAAEGDTDRTFALASLTKLLTAVAVLVAVEEGSLGLDLAAPPPAPAGATVRDLLCHASGLGPDGDAALAAPRRQRIYSNRGYELLGEMVTSHTGMAFSEYLEEGVLGPLSMSRTELRGSPAAGAVSTTADLLRFTAALTRPGLLSVVTLAAMAAPHYPSIGGVLPGFGRHDPNPWGLGPEVRGAKHPHWTGTANSARTFGHFGRAGTFCWLDPDAGVTLVVLTDHEFGDWARTAWPELSDAVLAAFPTPRP